MLRVTDVHAAYGQTEILHGVSLRVDEGEVVALIGPNGAGKSSLLRSISRSSDPVVTAGSLELDGRSIRSMTSHAVARSGLIHVPEGRHVFPGMTVRENLAAGRTAARGRVSEYTDVAAVERFFPRLAERRGQEASSLSGGEQQMLAIARGLLSGPRLLILDEPSLGLAPRVVDEIFDVIGALARSGLAILLVEQSTTRALALASRAYVFAEGRVMHEGSAAQIARDNLAEAIYLGRT